MIPTIEAPARRGRPASYVFYLVLFAFFVYATHLPWVSLPFYWDELGQFVPSALDLFRTGAWIPHSAVPNVHPPGVMAYLALVWQVAGYSIAATRAAMLLAASVALLLAFLLAIELCRETNSRPALLAVLLVGISPLFFAQAMMAQLDMPAMLFTAAALLLFIQEKPRAAALACVPLVLAKETGLIVVLVMALWLARERRWREAAWYLLPCAAVFAWILILWRGTGHPLGDTGFAHYNVLYPLHPVRFAVALVRRLNYLFISDLHWLGTIAVVLAWRRTHLFHTRAWQVAWLTVAAHVVLLSAAGGAALERYLLPVLPILYAAFTVAMTVWPTWARIAASAALAAALAIGNVWNPPYPFPLENNLAFTDFVKVHQQAARFIEQHYPGSRVATTWPLSAELRRPEFGYVQTRLSVRMLPDFRHATVDALDWNRTPVLVFYSPMWQPRWNLLEWSPIRALRTRFYDFEPEITSFELQTRGNLRMVKRWSSRSQWIEVYEAAPPKGTPNTSAAFWNARIR